MSRLEEIETPLEETEDRVGEWMATSLGGKFYPADLRPEEIFISDIANGLALDCRYAGQGRIDRFYSVAEHSYHMSKYAEDVNRMGATLAMAVLLHDAAEAYLNDIARAAKRAIGTGYVDIERPLEQMILEKYGAWSSSVDYTKYIKSLDCQIVPLEKEAIMRHYQKWAFDNFAPLDGVVIYCWEPEHAKRMFLEQYTHLCGRMDMEPEDYEI